MKSKLTVLLLFFMLSGASLFSQEKMMGEIRMFAGQFPPRGWAFCDGQVLNISQNTALFSILGTTYGGDGRTTFALPDLRGRVPVHVGDKNSDLSNVNVGQKGGSVSIELKKVSIYEDASGNSSETYTIKSSNSKLYTNSPYIGMNYIIALQGTYPSRN